MSHTRMHLLQLKKNIISSLFILRISKCFITKFWLLKTRKKCNLFPMWCDSQMNNATLYILTLSNFMFAFVLRLRNFSIYATTLNRKAKRTCSGLEWGLPTNKFSRRKMYQKYVILLLYKLISKRKLLKLTEYFF